MKLSIKHFDSQRNLIKAQMEQAKTHPLINDKDRPALIQTYELQLEKLDQKEKEFINNIEVEFQTY
jgi:hypothetical protein